jgi:hypothetical protein
MNRHTWCEVRHENPAHGPVHHVHTRLVLDPMYLSAPLMQAWCSNRRSCDYGEIGIHFKDIVICLIAHRIQNVGWVPVLVSSRSKRNSLSGYDICMDRQWQRYWVGTHHPQHEHIKGGSAKDADHLFNVFLLPSRYYYNLHKIFN